MDNSITQLGQQQLILVTGAARCGKSEWAETLAMESGKTVIYIATATIDPTDREWQARIIRHQQRRPATWQTVTAIEDLPSTISPISAFTVPSRRFSRHLGGKFTRSI